MTSTKSFIQKLKQRFSVSTLFYIVLFGIVIITTLFPVFFDLEHANWKKIISTMIIGTILILLSFTYQTERTKKLLENDEDGDYQKSKNIFINKNKEIQERRLSKLQKLYVDEQNEKIKKEYIQNVLQHYEIDEQCYSLDFPDLKLLLQENKITKKQFKIIKALKCNDFETDYYNFQDLTCTFIIEKGKNTNKSQQNSIIMSEAVYKIILLIVATFMWGTLVPDAVDGGITPQSWIDLGGRLINLCGGIFCGSNCGRLLVKDEIRLLDKFYNFNSLFLQEFQNGTWQPDDKIITRSIVDDLREIKEEKQNNENVDDSESEIIEISEEELSILKEKSNNT